MHTLRGVDSGDIVICDEMAFMPNRMFTEVIIPLLGMKQAKLLGISTPSPDEYNFFSRMLTLKYPGTEDYVFGNLIIDLACDECKKKDRAVDCRHMQNLIPNWKGGRKFELAAHLYGELNSTAHARESMGILMTADDKMYDRKHIDKLAKRPDWYRITRDCVPTHIFISVDPNAGGTSQMGIVSTAWVKNTYMVFFYFITKKTLSFSLSLSLNIHHPLPSLLPSCIIEPDNHSASAFLGIGHTERSTIRSCLLKWG